MNLTINDCNSNSLYSEWFVDITLDNNQLIQQPFFNGYGLTDFPSQSQWIQALQNSLPQLINYNLGYYINNSTLYVQNLLCGQNLQNQTFELNVGINFSINCS
jgi:hypothetical protein